MKTSKLSPRKSEKIAVMHRRRSRGVAQSEWHASEGEGAKRTCECRLLLILGMNSYLIIARISVEEEKVT